MWLLPPLHSLLPVVTVSLSGLSPLPPHQAPWPGSEGVCTLDLNLAVDGDVRGEFPSALNPLGFSPGV